MAKNRSTKKISVLMVDDHEPSRKGLRSILQIDGDIEVVGEAGNGEEVLAKVESLSPDIVLMDIRMARLDGIQATMRLKENNVSCAVIMLSAFDEYVIQALQAGAMGYLVKGTKREEICSAIRRVYHGEIVVSESLLSTQPRIAEVMAHLQKVLLEKAISGRKPSELEDKSDVCDILKLAEDIGFQSNTRNSEAPVAILLRKQLIQTEALSLIPEAMARRYKVIPMRDRG